MRSENLLLKPLTFTKLAFSALALTALAGCSWIDIDPKADQVKLMTIGDIQACQKMGEVQSHVMDKVGFIERDKEAIVENLVDLAKNEAVKLGGNALVPASTLKDGKMRFWLYNCPQTEQVKNK